MGKFSKLAAAVRETRKVHCSYAYAFQDKPAGRVWVAELPKLARTLPRNRYGWTTDKAQALELNAHQQYRFVVYAITYRLAGHGLEDVKTGQVELIP